MPNPYHMVTFATKTDISAFDFSTWPDGTPVFCKEANSWFVLDTSSTATVDDENVLTSASGRFLKQTAVGGASVATAKPTTAPSSVGQTLIVVLDENTVTERTIHYVSTGTSGVSDWKIIGGSTINADDTPIFYNIQPDFVGQQWNDNYTPGFYIGADYDTGGLIWIGNISGGEITTLGE